MKILDRYVLRVFLSTFFVVLCFALGIFVVINVFSVADKLQESGELLESLELTMTGVLVQYYLVSLPFFLMSLLPIITFVSAAIAIIRLLRGNEIAPMVASGRSPDRIARPIYIFAFLVTLGMLCMQEWVVPRLAEDRLRLDWITEGNIEGEVDDVPPMTDARGNTWSIEYYYPLTATIENVEVVRYKSPETGAHLGTLLVPRAVFRESGAQGAGWYPEGGLLLPPESGTEESAVRELSSVEPLRTTLTATALEQERTRRDREAGKMLSISEAARMLGQPPDLPRQRVAFHSLLTWPIANLLIVILGLPVIFRLGERNLFVGIGIALLICASYFGLDVVCKDLGGRLVLVPSFAAWLPVAVFASLTVAGRLSARL